MSSAPGHLGVGSPDVGVGRTRRANTGSPDAKNVGRTRMSGETAGILFGLLQKHSFLERGLVATTFLGQGLVATTVVERAATFLVQGLATTTLQQQDSNNRQQL